MRRKQAVFAIHGFEAKWVRSSLVIYARDFRPREETVDEYVEQVRELIELALDARPDLRNHMEQLQVRRKARAERAVHALQDAVGSRAFMFTHALQQWRSGQKHKQEAPDLRKLFEIVKKTGGEA